MIVFFGSVSPSSFSESTNESGSDSCENSCVSSGKGCVSCDESLEPVATENGIAEYAAEVVREEQQEAEFQTYSGPHLSRQKQITPII